MERRTRNRPLGKQDKHDPGCCVLQHTQHNTWQTQLSPRALHLTLRLHYSLSNLCSTRQYIVKKCHHPPAYSRCNGSGSSASACCLLTNTFLQSLLLLLTPNPGPPCKCCFKTLCHALAQAGTTIYHGLFLRQIKSSFLHFPDSDWIQIARSLYDKMQRACIICSERQLRIIIKLNQGFMLKLQWKYGSGPNEKMRQDVPDIADAVADQALIEHTFHGIVYRKHLMCAMP